MKQDGLVDRKTHETPLTLFMSTRIFSWLDFIFNSFIYFFLIPCCACVSVVCVCVCVYGDVVVVLVFYYASALVCVVLAVSLSSLILSHLYVPINGSSRQLNNNAPNSGRVPSTQSNPVWCAFLLLLLWLLLHSGRLIAIVLIALL